MTESGGGPISDSSGEGWRNAPPPPVPPTGPAYPLAPPTSLTPESGVAQQAVPTATGLGLRYYALQRGGRYSWWRSLLGVVSLALLSMLLVPLILQLGLLAGFALTGAEDPVQSAFDAIDLDDVSPLGLGYLMLSLAMLVPITWLVMWSLHGLKPRWLTSVVPKMRWKYFTVCLGLSVVALIATLIVSGLITAFAGESAVAGADETLSANPVDGTMIAFIVVVVVLTPFQAAGEEYAFRGYLTQAFGASMGVWAAVLGPATLFALAHGSQSLPVFIDRFAFGLVAGVLVVMTGGLEAAIAMHVLNNVMAFGLAIAFGNLGEALQPSGGSWWMVPSTMTQSLVYLGLALLVAKGMGLRSRTDPGVLAAPTPRV